MLRALFVLAIVFLVAAGFAWLAERPGDLTLTWQGYEIRTSLMVAAIGVAIVIAAIAALGALVHTYNAHTHQNTHTQNGATSDSPNLPRFQRLQLRNEALDRLWAVAVVKHAAGDIAK